MSGLSRRQFLSRVAGGSVATAAAVSGSALLAGCTSLFSTDPPPIDVEEGDFAGLLDDKPPELPRELPVGIGAEHVDTWTDRVTTLLDEIPPSLTNEIPNEAVRQFIEERRKAAQDAQADVDAERTDDGDAPGRYDVVRTHRRARRNAAAAEGAYVAARGERDREDVSDALVATKERLETVAGELTRYGDDARHVLVTSEAVERRLDRVESGIDGVLRTSPLASAVEAVGDGADRLEGLEARLDTAVHVLDRQNAATSNGRSFDDDFERVAAELLADVKSRDDSIPEDVGDAPELFDATVRDTPRQVAAEELVVTHHFANADRVEEVLAQGFSASGLLDLHRIEIERRVIDRIRARVADGDLDRPTDADPVRDERGAAIGAIEMIWEETEPDDRYLVERGLARAITTVRSGDQYVEQFAPTSERAVLNAIGNYAVAAERARAVPGATEWLVRALP